MKMVTLSYVKIGKKNFVLFPSKKKEGGLIPAKLAKITEKEKEVLKNFLKEKEVKA